MPPLLHPSCGGLQQSGLAQPFLSNKQLVLDGWAGLLMFSCHQLGCWVVLELGRWVLLLMWFSSTEAVALLHCLSGFCGRPKQPAPLIVDPLITQKATVRAVCIAFVAPVAVMML
jgi:hypothetical protein